MLTWPPVTGILHQRAQQMQAGVHAHESCSGCPSQVRRGRSDRPPGAALHPRAHAQSSVLSASQTVVVIGTAVATLELDAAAIARLPAGGGVKDRPIQHDATAIVDGEHLRGTVAQA